MVGTRTASITIVAALIDALKVIKSVAAKAVIAQADDAQCHRWGMYQGEPVLDLDYLEDSAAETDLNVVMTSSGGIEVQGTAKARSSRLT
jgi:ribonuclease PH